jgi:hemerythrin-like metal-binding protein
MVITMVEYIAWCDSEFSVGIPIIDEQHKKIFKLINELFNSMKLGKSEQIVSTILEELVEYTKYHFQAEEGYLIQCNYPEFSNHKQLHTKLIDEVKAIQQQVIVTTTSKANYTVDILDLLKNWLMNHIKKMDKKYVPYMKNLKTL